MACEGTCPITSKKFISSLTHKNVHDNITTKYDHVLHAKTRFNRGGWCVYDTSFGYYRHGSVGWMGLGGSALQWHKYVINYLISSIFFPFFFYLLLIIIFNII